MSALGPPFVLAKRRVAPSASRWASRWSFDTSTPMVSCFIFSMPLLVIRGSPPGIRSGQRKRRGRSNSSSTRQTVSVLPIRPSPLTRGQPPSPSGPSRLLGAKSHKTSFLLLDLRVSCVVEVCGAFGGRVLGEDFAAGVGDRLVASRSRLSRQSFELGEDLLDRVEVGGVFRQEDEAGSDIPDRLAPRLSLVGAEIVEDHDLARLQRRDQERFDIGVEALAVDGPVEQAGRVDAVVAQGGEESRGLPLALRDLVDQALFPWRPAAQAGQIGLGPEPAPAQAGVSSMKMSRLGSMSP